MAGFVYIMSNESFKNGLLKIGMSASDPTEFRQDQLYTTGVPTPFKVEYFAFVDEHEEIERIIHYRLCEKRPNSGREFFSCGVSEAILMIRESAQIHYEKVFYKSSQEIEEERQRKEASERQRLDEERQRKEAGERQRGDKERKKLERISGIKNTVKNAAADIIMVTIGMALIFFTFPFALAMGSFGWVVMLIIGGLIIYFINFIQSNR